MDRALSHRGFRADRSTRILREFGISEPAILPKTLSSNQIFMGILSSPRSLHMLEVSRAMSHVMDPRLQEIDRELILLFTRSLTVRCLQLRVFVVAEPLDKSCPKAKSRVSLSEWPHINWRQSKAMMLREFLGTSELMTIDDS
jgi:hypothetical protein